MKVCVLGPHGSGNRLNGRMLRACPEVSQAGALSFPGEMPPMKGYDESDFFVWSIRGKHPTTQSMLKEGMVADIAKAEEWYEEACDQIAEFLHDTSKRWLPVVYENTVSFGSAHQIGRMAKALGVDPWPFDEAIVDGNAKYEHLRSDTE